MHVKKIYKKAWIVESLKYINIVKYSTNKTRRKDVINTLSFRKYT